MSDGSQDLGDERLDYVLATDAEEAVRQAFVVGYTKAPGLAEPFTTWQIAEYMKQAEDDAQKYVEKIFGR
jgi:hypothetical protein